MVSRWRYILVQRVMVMQRVKVMVMQRVMVRVNMSRLRRIATFPFTLTPYQSPSHAYPNSPLHTHTRARAHTHSPSSGIWQPVWLEVVPSHHITALKMSPNTTHLNLNVITTPSMEPGARVMVTVMDGREVVTTVKGFPNVPWAIEVCVYVCVCMCIFMYVCVYVCARVWYQSRILPLALVPSPIAHHHQTIHTNTHTYTHTSHHPRFPPLSFGLPSHPFFTTLPSPSFEEVVIVMVMMMGMMTVMVMMAVILRTRWGPTSV